MTYSYQWHFKQSRLEGKTFERKLKVLFHGKMFPKKVYHGFGRVASGIIVAFLVTNILVFGGLYYLALLPLLVYLDRTIYGFGKDTPRPFTMLLGHIVYKLLPRDKRDDWLSEDVRQLPKFW